jgi:hypothetical protein
MDLLTGKARKNNYPLRSVGISLEKIIILQKKYRIQFRR